MDVNHIVGKKSLVGIGPPILPVSWDHGHEPKI